MNRWHLLGGLLGALLGHTANALAECAYVYDYDYVDIHLASVTLAGAEVEDLSGYLDYRVTVVAGGDYDAEVRVTELDGTEVTTEIWE